MKKYLWSTIDSKGKREPFVVLECNSRVAKEVERRRNENLWKYIADHLHEKYPDKFQDWFDEYGKRRLFWYNNVLEDYNAGYKRIVEEMSVAIINSYNKGKSKRLLAEVEYSLMSEVGWQVHQDLEILPVFEL